jgi:hypothetical protein
MAQARAIAEHLAFVVIHRDPRRLIDELCKLITIEHRQTLAWIKHKRNVSVLELFSMLQHGIATVWGNDAQLDVRTLFNPQAVRLHHGAWVKCRDLVVIAIGHDHGLRGVCVFNLADKLGRNAQACQTFQVISTI